MSDAEQDPRVGIIQAGLVKIMSGTHTEVPVSDAHDEIDAIAYGINVLVEQLHAEIDSQKRLRSELDQVLGTMNDGLVVVSEQGNILRANQAIAQLMGCPVSQLEGSPFSQLWVSDGTISTLEKRMFTRGGVEQREEYLDAPDSPIPVSLSAAALPTEDGEERRFVCTIHDLRRIKKLVQAEANAEAERGRADEIEEAHTALAQTVQELKETQEQLVQAQKLDALGRLAGGIAHDFNNLLAVVLGSADLIQKFSKETPKVAREAENIVNASIQARSLTNQLLTFARKQPQNASPFYVDKLVESASSMIERLLPSDVSWRVERRGKDFPVLADEARMQQVLINLAVNARDAMPSGGTISVATHQFVLGEADAAKLQLKPGEYMAIELQDSGSGIPDEIREKIFDPFFTTKAAGKGTGLGLAICYGIVRRAGGSIQVESEVGVGTLVRVLLPRAKKMGSGEFPSVPPPGPDSSRQAVVLVVDDEAEVRRFISHALRELNYQVLEADCGERALELVAESDLKVAVVVTDVRMPKMGGVELADRLREGDGALRVLYVSGHADAELPTIEEGGPNGFLAKPFRSSDLTSAVARLLANEPAY